MYVKKGTEETNTERRVDTAIANLEHLAQLHARRWRTGNVIWAGERFEQGRART